MPEMIPSLIMGNLRRAQAFDASLKTTNRIDVIANDFTDAILYQRNEGKRAKKIDELVNELVKESQKSILPQGERIGTQNAVDILSKTPTPKGVDLANAQERGAALFNSKLKAKQRLAIVKSSVDANGKQLDAALTRYWLEPSEGKSVVKRAERLQEIHNKLEAKRKAWEKDLQDFHDGERKSRPNPPKLDYMSEMTSESKKDIRVQSRRSGTDAEISKFVSEGHKYLVWIAPNGLAACPDCINRKNVVLTLDQWEEIGRPGSGKTVCEIHCFCMLIPKETVSSAPGLITKRESVELGPLTDQGLFNFLNANRIEKTTR